MSGCPVKRTVSGNKCDGPGTYYCDSDLWHSACRRYFEEREAAAEDPCPVAVHLSDGSEIGCVLRRGHDGEHLYDAGRAPVVKLISAGTPKVSVRGW